MLIKRPIEGVLLNSSSAAMIALCLGLSAPLVLSELPNVGFLIACFVLNVLIALRYRLAILSLIAVSVFGVIWASSTFKTHQERVLPSQFEQEELYVTGVVHGLPVEAGGNVRFNFRVTEKLGTAIQSGSLLKLACYRCALGIEPNQKWQLTVRLKQPHGYASWGAFDSEKYLFRNRVVAKGYVRAKSHNKLIGIEQGWVTRLRWKVKKHLEKLNDGVNSVGIGMVAAISIGDKSMLNTEQKKVFQESGISHLMAISGLHIGLVFVLVNFLFRWLSMLFAQLYNVLPRQHLCLIPALLSALMYAALAGFAVSTQRAFIMLSVYVFCRLMVRTVSLYKVLLIAACLILLLDPFSILDTGFWLSCGAVLIIAKISQHKESISLFKLQPQLWLWMLPMNVLFFGKVSVISLFVNLIAVPVFCFVLIPFTLLSVLFLLLEMEFIGVGMVRYIGHCYEWIYQLLLNLVGYPFSSLQTLQWHSMHSVVLCMVLLAYYCKFRFRHALWSVLIVSFFISPIQLFRHFQQQTTLQLVMLDVGQGLSMVVHIEPEDYTLVYDTGPRFPSGFNLADAVLIPYLNANGFDRVDRLIISHADNDHIGGFKRLAEEMPITDILSSRTDIITSARGCQAGQQWQVGDVMFTMLSPTPSTPKGSNNRSCVLRIELAGTRVLISGDIEKQVERYLLKQYEESRDELGADILLVPHQGSKTSSTEAFIDAVNPSLALIAAGYRNHYGHPHPVVVSRYQQRNIELASTIDNGSVLITINRDGWQQQSFREVEAKFWRHQKKPN